MTTVCPAEISVDEVGVSSADNGTENRFFKSKLLPDKNAECDITKLNILSQHACTQTHTHKNIYVKLLLLVADTTPSRILSDINRKFKLSY